MITQPFMIADAPTDAVLVQKSLAGNTSAFSQIVARYQALICSLTYNGTGCLSRSEDLAQEVFVTAWRELRQLREPSKLRSWLCGIARRLTANLVRREVRDPVADAVELDAEHVAACPDPAEHAIAREEEAILWRSLEQIPETYREPLILFYREGESVQKVAAALDLTEDAAKQRLSRGRKLLQEQVAGFVEATLRQSSPGRAFTLGVIAALPLMTTSAAAATIGTTAAKGTAAAMGASFLAVLGAVLGPVVGCLGAWMGFKASLEAATSERERRFVVKHTRLMIAIMVGFLAFMFAALAYRPANPGVMIGIQAIAVLIYVAVIVALVFRFNATQRRIRREEAVHRTPAMAQMAQRKAKAWQTVDYKSKAQFLGLPLLHVRTGRCVEEKLIPACGWIAIGDLAIGVIAIGGVAIGIISLGGICAGALAIGGVALGLLSFGGVALGIGAAGGGLAIGYLAHGGCSIAWHAAEGGLAWARDFAIGGRAFADHANDETARQTIQSLSFFKAAAAATRNPAWWTLIWLPMILIVWQAMRTRKALKASASENDE